MYQETENIKLVQLLGCMATKQPQPMFTGFLAVALDYDVLPCLLKMSWLTWQ